jgi:hypothetical protein
MQRLGPAAEMYSSVELCRNSDVYTSACCRRAYRKGPLLSLRHARVRNRVSAPRQVILFAGTVDAEEQTAQDYLLEGPFQFQSSKDIPRAVRSI